MANFWDMNKLILIFLLLAVSFLPVGGQALETIGGGVADYLLSSPKTVNRMNADQQIALSIIGNLLKTAGERKHEINVAQAGKTEINLSTNTGQQLQLVMDQNGNVFAMSNGMIYPISSKVVDEAKNYILNQQPGYMDYVKLNSKSNNILMLPNFNYTQIENKWNKKKTCSLQPIEIGNSLYLTDILDKFEIKYEDLYILNGKEYKPFNNYRSDDIRLIKLKKFGSGFLSYKSGGKEYAFWNSAFNKVGPIEGPIYLCLVDYVERGSFVAKWINDLNNNGISEFEEFLDIRRNFYENESFVIAAGLYSQYSYKIKIKILNQISGEIVFDDLAGNSDEEINRGYFSFKSNTFKPGIYVYHISFVRSKTNEELSKLSDQFQILAISQKNEVGNTENPIIDTKSDETSSKTKMINDLIQLLKEGKISEETFKASMKAIENK